MRVGKKQEVVLFALALYLQETNKRFRDAPLNVSVSKSVFIDLLKKSKLAEKSTRALYKNLEILENKKMISYEKRCLSLGKKGLKHFNRIAKEHMPYIQVSEIIKKGVQGRKVQARFK